MADLHRYRFSHEVNRPLGAPADTYFHYQSLQNPLHHSHLGNESLLLNSFCNENLESVFSRLNVNDQNKHLGLDDLLCDTSDFYDSMEDYFFGMEGCRPIEQAHSLGFRDCSSNGFVPGVYSTSNNFSRTSLNQNGFLSDFTNGELNTSRYSISTPSSSRNGLFNGAVSKKHDFMRSSLSRPQWLQETFDGLSLPDLRGNFVALAKDHYGCRFLQKTMKSTTREQLDMIFMELINHVCDLMVDPFGNYVMQKLVEVCSEEQRTQILVMLTKTNFQLVRICLDMHGTRAVQRLLECLTTPQQISLVTAAISTGAVALTKDMNGHHVIQHCLKYFSDDDNKYLLNELANNCYGVATDKSGCCVLQHCVQYSKGEPRERLVSEIIGNALHLADDHYGNYVVQHILEMKVPQITADLLRQLEGHYASLSCNKYGSNVVEKCLKVSGEQQSMRIVVELLRSRNASMILLDPYGNYVIQSALSVSKGFLFDALRNLVKMNYHAMHNNIYGRKVIAWFEKNKLYI
ncbi:hypothetical protein ACOSQ2_010886 [Xanthoceras sorbifolium]